MDKESRQYVIGTAGHIDHGKTALIQALTGINTDRLKEEQERGITIDLGFAHFSDNVTIIDVPGHERLIKNMVAGVSTIDLVLFVIAADDGIMPQTREHLDIVKLLGISHGVFAITKIDLVDEEWLLMVEEEIGNLLKGSVFENAPVLKTSAVTGEGIEDVRKTIFESLKQIERRKDDGIFRLPIDRVFSKPGFGTVVTGSVLSGQIGAGGAVEILPELIPARVRGLQSHDRPVESVSMGDRAALNLTGIGNEQLHRGQVIAQAGYYRAVQSFNARLTPLPDETVLIKDRMRVRIHLHTAEILARLVLPEPKALGPGQSALVQFRLEKPVYASFGDHFIIRQYSPQITLGGGIVLETNPPKYRKRNHDLFVQRLENLESDDPERRIPAAFSDIDLSPCSVRDIRIRTGLPLANPERILEKLEKKNEIFRLHRGQDVLYYSRRQAEKVLESFRQILRKFHEKNPGRSGLPVSELQSQTGQFIPEDVIRLAVKLGLDKRELRKEGDLLADARFETKLTDKKLKLLEQLEAIYREAQLSPPVEKELLDRFPINEKDLRELLRILREQGRIVLAEEKLFFHADAIAEAEQIIRKFFEKNDGMEVPEFKELTGTTRKYAIPLLNYFDNLGITSREENMRVPGPRLRNE